MRYVSHSLAACLLLAGCSTLPSWLGGDETQEPTLPGKRIAVMESVSQLKPDSSLLDESFELPIAVANPSWPQEGGNAASRMEHLKLNGLEASQSVSVGEGNGWNTALVPGPIVAEGKVFAMDAEGYISAHEAGNISNVIWKSEAAAGEREMVGGGLAYADGRVFATTDDGRVYALRAEDGGVIWTKALKIPTRAAPRAYDNLLLVLTVDNELVALDTASGANFWSFSGIKETAGFLSAVQPAAADETIILPTTSSEILALSARDGKRFWSEILLLSRRTSATDIFTGIDANPVVVSGQVYSVSNNGLMLANDLVTGRTIWERELSAHLTPWVAGDYLFLITNDDQLLALHRRDGRIRWQTALPRGEDGERREYSAPMLLSGLLLTLDRYGTMVAFDPATGKKLQESELPDNVTAPPAVAAGVMYLLDGGATLHAVR